MSVQVSDERLKKIAKKALYDYHTASEGMVLVVTRRGACFTIEEDRCPKNSYLKINCPGINNVDNSYWFGE